MSSTERLALKGKLFELKENKNKLRLKISGNIKLLKSYFFEVEHEEINQFEEKSIEVFSNELVEKIAEIKTVNDQIKEIENELK